MLKKLILISVSLIFAVASVRMSAGQAKMPTSPCKIKVADLSGLAGVTFDIKIDELKKQYKTVRILTPSKNEIIDQTKIYTLRPLIIDPVFKEDLLTVDLAQSSKLGISSIALNFRPKTKLTPDELFSKINLETGLLPTNWSYNDFGGKANYRKWDVVCKDFSGSFIAQTGYMNRFIIWRSPDSDPRKKTVDSRNIGD